MSKTDAAYMRAYRERKKLEAAMMTVTQKPGLTIVGDEHWALVVKENADLREEVRHLKEELAKRPRPRSDVTTQRVVLDMVGTAGPIGKASGFNTHPFTPVPKVRGGR